MRYIFLSLLLGLIALAISFSTVGTAQTSVQPQPPSAKELRKKSTKCKKLYSRKMFHRAAKPTYRGANYVSQAKKDKIIKFVRCQRSEKSERNVRKHLANYKQANARRRAIAAVTPYPGPNGTRWAIPFFIIRCESTTIATPQGGDWNVVNRIGAVGPYQFLDKAIVWPVRTAAHKLAHHRLAAKLYSGGTGAYHWAQCL